MKRSDFNTLGRLYAPYIYRVACLIQPDRGVGNRHQTGLKKERSML